MQYIYDMVINLMMKTSGRYVLNRIDFGSYSEVTPYEIHCMCRDISESDILSILRYRNRTSLNQLMEEGMLEIDVIQGDEGIQLEVFVLMLILLVNEPICKPFKEK